MRIGSGAPTSIPGSASDGTDGPSLGEASQTQAASERFLTDGVDNEPEIAFYAADSVDGAQSTSERTLQRVKDAVAEYAETHKDEVDFDQVDDFLNDLSEGIQKRTTLPTKDIYDALKVWINDFKNFNEWLEETFPHGNLPKEGLDGARGSGGTRGAGGAGGSHGYGGEGAGGAGGAGGGGGIDEDISPEAHGFEVPQHDYEG